MPKRTLLIIIVAVIGLGLIGGIIYYLRTRDIDGGRSRMQPIESAEPSTEPSESERAIIEDYTYEQRLDLLSEESKQQLQGNDPNAARIIPSTEEQEAAREAAANLNPDAPIENAATTQAPPASPPSQQAPAPIPGAPDADGDGLTDEQEIQIGTDVNNPDSDGDGLSDYDEAVRYKTNPRNPDSDGDGFTDGSEVGNGYDPLGPGRCLRPDCTP